MKPQKPCHGCVFFAMDKIDYRFRWVCNHATQGRDFGTPGEVVINNWSGIPDECPFVTDRDAALLT